MEEKKACGICVFTTQESKRVDHGYYSKFVWTPATPPNIKAPVTKDLMESEAWSDARRLLRLDKAAPEMCEIYSSMVDCDTSPDRSAR